MATIKQQVEAVSTTLAAIVANWVDVPTTPAPTPTPTPGQERDPRSERAKAYNYAGAKVQGVALTYHRMPDTRFEIVDADVFTEDESVNETKAIVHVLRWAYLGGQWVLIPARARVYLAWPINTAGDPNSLETWQLPGNVNEPYEHIITNGFTPPKKGPLAIFVGSDSGQIDSDVVGGVGLPVNRHVSFHITVVERFEQRLWR